MKKHVFKDYTKGKKITLKKNLTWITKKQLTLKSTATIKFYQLSNLTYRKDGQSQCYKHNYIKFCCV